MNIGFFIDKSQTVQSILGLVRESQKRGYSIDVHSTCDKSSLASIPSIGIDLNGVSWTTYTNRDNVRLGILDSFDKYHAMVGINLFNSIWRKIYETTNYTNIYAVEYCWNEIYNHRTDYEGFSTLFCNSEWSKSTIKDLTGYKNIKFLGSPWFEVIKDFSTMKDTSENIITFMAPHNSFVSNYKGFLDKVCLFLPLLRKFCDKTGNKLILKTRQKYSYPYHKFVNFDGVVTDDNIVSHLRLYANSNCVFNFSSSAINELSFLETPYVCLFSDLHANLHKNRENLFNAMSLINSQYYSGDIFDGVHCDVINSHPDLSQDGFLTMVNERLDSISQMISSKDRDWNKFQKTYFPGNHDNSSSRIIDQIKQQCHIGK